MNNARARSETGAPHIVALDLGGTKLGSAIISSGGRIFRRNVTLLEKRCGREVGGLIRGEIIGLLGYSREKHLSISAISICVPGVAYKSTGKVWASNIPGWNNYPLRREIESTLGKLDASYRNLPIHITSDRACYILGEAWRGNAKGCANAIFLAVGTGIGAGIMVDGSVLHGAHGIAGAVGWIALDRPFRREYKTCGCFESHASGTALTKATKGFRTIPDRGHRDPSLQHFIIPPPSVFSAADAGDPKAKKRLCEAVEYWGMAVANLVSIFNPEVIVFGGGVFGPAKKFIPAIHKEAKKWAQPIAIKQVKLKPSKLGPDAALLGAAYIALSDAC